MEQDQQEDSQINRRLFLLSLCRMKKIMLISANLSIPIAIKAGNVGLARAITESCRIMPHQSLKLLQFDRVRHLRYTYIHVHSTLLRLLPFALRRRLDG